MKSLKVWDPWSVKNMWNIACLTLCTYLCIYCIVYIALLQLLLMYICHLCCVQARHWCPRTTCKAWPGLIQVASRYSVNKAEEMRCWDKSPDTRLTVPPLSPTPVITALTKEYKKKGERFNLTGISHYLLTSLTYWLWFDTGSWDTEEEGTSWSPQSPPCSSHSALRPW